MHSEKIKTILKILEKNIKDNARPGSMESDRIAKKLNISLKETKQLLTSMNSIGIIECNIEANYSLITHRGLRQLNY